MALIRFTPPAEKWCQFLLTLEKEKKEREDLECRGAVLQNGLGRDITQLFTLPILCSYLTKYTISLCPLLIQKYPFMSVSKCCPPYLFHWGLVPVVSTVGTGEGEVLLKLWIRHCVDINGGH